MDRVMPAFKNEKSLEDEINSIFIIFNELSFKQIKLTFFKGKSLT